MTIDITQLKSVIDTELETHLPASSEIAQPIVDAMRHAVMGGGKRMRPMLAGAACQAACGNYEPGLAPGCAIEFIHAYSLIHDDLPAMDDDEIRHGLPSAHIAFGEANAILAGDSLHSLAFQTIANASDLDANTKLKMINLLASAAGWAGMAGGQCLDIAAEGKSLSLPQLKTLHGAKTGALIRVSVEFGALAATSANECQLSAHQYELLQTFGDKVGLAFQVMDDVLDITQSTEQLGKPAGSDEAQNKNTFPRLMGIKPAQDLAYRLVDESLRLLEQTDLDTTALAGLAKLAIERDH